MNRMLKKCLTESGANYDTRLKVWNMDNTAVEQFAAALFSSAGNMLKCNDTEAKDITYAQYVLSEKGRRAMMKKLNYKEWVEEDARFYYSDKNSPWCDLVVSGKSNKVLGVDVHSPADSFKICVCSTSTIDSRTITTFLDVFRDYVDEEGIDKAERNEQFTNIDLLGLL